ncbi:oligosaccharide flippase family protein [Parafrankia sp. FMc2]|uniref:oligosaccharide flippase family protein n=1 Tax=Parafrankia sp. FMc2 TaxID=3233196 RepID=UPI0034D7A8E1
MTSIAFTVLGSASGILLARYLGAAGRGSYAAVGAYLMAAATIGEFGLTAAICFYVARNPAAARDIVRTGGALLLALGTVVGVAGFLAAPILAKDDQNAVTAFRIAFLAQPVIFVAACWTFALQATRISAWNWLRVIQPFANLGIILILVSAWTLTLEQAMFCLVGSLVLQAVVAQQLCRRSLPGRGALRADVSRDLLRYGGANLLASAPNLLNSNLDILVLALLVDSADLGHYAVAVSMSQLTLPVCAAFGNVAMPRLAASPSAARRSSPRQIVFAGVVGSLTVGTCAAVVTGALCPLVIPLLFGDDFRASILLIWLLVPGTAVLGCNRAMGDMLRGLNRSLAIARCEGVGAVLTIIVLSSLVSTMGVAGAAIASSVAYTTTFFLLFYALLRAVDIPIGSVPSGLRRLAIAHVNRNRSAVLAGEDNAT